MLLIFLSTLESWAVSSRITSSPCIAGPCVTVPSIRPPVAPPAGLAAVPTVADPRGEEVADPPEFAVPRLLVPGALVTALEFDELRRSFAPGVPVPVGPV